MADAFVPRVHQPCQPSTGRSQDRNPHAGLLTLPRAPDCQSVGRPALERWPLGDECHGRSGAPCGGPGVGHSTVGAHGAAQGPVRASLQRFGGPTVRRTRAAWRVARGMSCLLRGVGRCGGCVCWRGQGSFLERHRRRGRLECGGVGAWTNPLHGDCVRLRRTRNTNKQGSSALLLPSHHEPLCQSNRMM